MGTGVESLKSGIGSLKAGIGSLKSSLEFVQDSLGGLVVSETEADEVQRVS